MDLGIQRKILKCFLVDKEFVIKYIEYITLDFFENEVHAKIFDFLKKYFIKYKKVPTKEVLLSEVVKSELDMLEFEKLVNEDIDERDWLDDKCRQFVLYSRLKRALQEGIEIFKKGNVDDYSLIRHKIDEALKVKFGDIFYEYFDEDKIKERLEEDVVKLRYPTGIQQLDNLLEGGLGKGELGVVAGVTGFGKSMLLQNFAVSCVLLGGKVLYYTFEEREQEVARRFDSIFTKMSKDLIKLDKGKFVEKLRKILEESRGNLLIKFYPPYRASVFTVRNDIENLMMAGKNINMVVIDYGQLLKSDKKYDERWQELVYIYESLSGLALEFDVPVWTAVQVMKSAMKKDYPDLFHVSGAKDVINCAQVAISIAQRDDEREKGVMRLFLAKARRTGARKMIKVKVIYDMLLVRDYTSDDEVEEMVSGDRGIPEFRLEDDEISLGIEENYNDEEEEDDGIF